MHIEGRKDKPYSESLFNQLLLLSMIIQSENYLPSYIIDSRLHKAERTYRRYFFNLRQCGLIPKVNYVREDNSYYIPFEIDDMERYYSAYDKKYHIDKKDALIRFLKSYSKEHINPDDRLSRLGRILICSIQDCYLDDSYYLEDDDSDELDLSDIDMTDMVIYDNKFYHIAFTGYEDLYKNLSARSRQRDFKLLKDVIISILSDYDAFGGY